MALSVEQLMRDYGYSAQEAESMVQDNNQAQQNAGVVVGSTPAVGTSNASAAVPAAAAGSSGTTGSSYDDAIAAALEKIQGQSSSYNSQLRALRRAQEEAEAARKASYNQAVGDLTSGISDAQRQAYVNYKLSNKNVPAAMAASGYSGGMTESTAGNLASSYQNALTDLETQKAKELATLQSNLASGVAADNTAYQSQIAQTLGAINSDQYNRDMQQIDLLRALRSDELTAQQTAAAGSTGTTETTGYTTSQIKEMVNAGVIDADEAREMLGLAAKTTTYRQYVNDVAEQLQMFKSATAAANYVNSISKNLTNEEIEYLQSLISKI